MNVRLTEATLRRIIREELVREARPGARFDLSTGDMSFGGRAVDRVPSEEEDWTASVRKGERGAKRHRYSAPVQQDIDDTEEYMMDVGDVAPGDELGAYMYGSPQATGHSDEDIILDLTDDEDELQPGEEWDQNAYYGR